MSQEVQWQYVNIEKNNFYLRTDDGNLFYVYDVDVRTDDNPFPKFYYVNAGAVLADSAKIKLGSSRSCVSYSFGFENDFINIENDLLRYTFFKQLKSGTKELSNLIDFAKKQNLYIHLT